MANKREIVRKVLLELKKKKLLKESPEGDSNALTTMLQECVQMLTDIPNGLQSILASTVSSEDVEILEQAIAKIEYVNKQLNDTITKNTAGLTEDENPGAVNMTVDNLVKQPETFKKLSDKNINVDVIDDQGKNLAEASSPNSGSLITDIETFFNSKSNAKFLVSAQGSGNKFGVQIRVNVKPVQEMSPQEQVATKKKLIDFGKRKVREFCYEWNGTSQNEIAPTGYQWNNTIWATIAYIEFKKPIQTESKKKVTEAFDKPTKEKIKSTWDKKKLKSIQLEIRRILSQFVDRDLTGTQIFSELNKDALRYKFYFSSHININELAKEIKKSLPGIIIKEPNDSSQYKIGLNFYIPYSLFQLPSTAKTSQSDDLGNVFAESKKIVKK